MKKIIIAATAIALTTACGGEAGSGPAGGSANSAVSANAAADDHDEAVPTAAAEEKHEHEGNEAEHAH